MVTALGDPHRFQAHQELRDMQEMSPKGQIHWARRRPTSQRGKRLKLMFPDFIYRLKISFCCYPLLQI